MKFILRIGLLCKYQQIHPKYGHQYFFKINSVLNFSYDSRCNIIHTIFVILKMYLHGRSPAMTSQLLTNQVTDSPDPIGKTPVRIILWCPITKMVIKACFLIQPLEQEGGCQKCCISLCSKVFINHFYQMKASPECLNILTYRSRYWVDRLRRTTRRTI